MGMDPVTLAMAAAAVSAATGVMGGISAFNQGQQANKAAKAAAAQAIATGNTNAAVVRRQGSIAIGKQRAAIAASGGDLLGNSLDLIEMTTAENELQAQSVLTNARFNAYNYFVQGKQAASQGRMALYKSIGGAAASALSAGAMGGGGAGVTPTYSAGYGDAYSSMFNGTSLDSSNFALSTSL